MTTYNSYQEAKIANPDASIYKYRDNYQSGDTPCRANERWVKCNPADHCMTVEKFLADGHEFVEGDIISPGSCWNDTVTKSEIDSYNEPGEDDCLIYILRAAALENKMNTDRLETQSEEQPKRVKVDEYSEYPNSADCKVSSILTLVESEFGSGALFAVADVLSGYKSIKM